MSSSILNGKPVPTNASIRGRSVDTWIRFPLLNAPSPAEAHQRSPVDPETIAPATGCPSTATATLAQ